MKKGFTLIELLAVIIILAVIALIATPIVLNSIDDAKTSAHKSSVAMFADAIKLAVAEEYFANQTYPTIDIDWINSNVQYGGGKVTCEEGYYLDTTGVVLHNCSVTDQVGYNFIDDIKVQAESLYCYSRQKVYTDCAEVSYVSDYNAAKSASSNVAAGTANAPELYNNKMIPVTYNGTNWVVANTSTEWYNYDNKNWANVVILNTGVTKNVGNVVNVATEVAQMYVWIPRYKYTIFNGVGDTGVTTQEINITFENGISSTGTVSCNDAVSGGGTSSETCTDKNGTITNGVSTYTHPAFCFGNRTNGVCDGTELKGIWVGKFENSTSNATCIATPSAANCNVVSTVIIKPNVYSWRYTQLANFYVSISNISSTYGITNADSHMMKNMEWGSVAYLSHSKYGINTEIGINNNTSYTTGCGATAGSGPSAGCNTYNTVNGQLASTTGNIYVISDPTIGTFVVVTILPIT